MTTDLLVSSQGLRISITQTNMSFGVAYNIGRVGCKLVVECIIQVRSILSWRNSSGSQSWTLAVVHRILQRDIVPTRWTAKLLV
jgi:hypothetical protein